MRALVQHQFGDPAEVLAVEEVELPEPGPGQVRLKVVLSPIHNHDLWTVRGDYGYKPELPARAGTEALLVPGAKVLVNAQARNGTPTALRVLVGRNGFTPPM